MLSDLGYTAIELHRAENALQLIREGCRPDVLVTDDLMPGVSGAVMARRLRSGFPELPVLIVSGYAEADGIDADIARLTKPFRSDELAASLSGPNAR